MATTHALPANIALSPKTTHVRPRPRDIGSVRVVAGLHRLLLLLKCPQHAWNWPRTNQEEHVSGFDAHQTCFKCHSQRLFDSKEWHPGPIYRNRRHSDD